MSKSSLINQFAVKDKVPADQYVVLNNVRSISFTLWILCLFPLSTSSSCTEQAHSSSILSKIKWKHPPLWGIQRAIDTTHFDNAWHVKEQQQQPLHEWLQHEYPLKSIKMCWRSGAWHSYGLSLEFFVQPCMDRRGNDRASPQCGVGCALSSLMLWKVPFDTKGTAEDPGIGGAFVNASEVSLSLIPLYILKYCWP